MIQYPEKFNLGNFGNHVNLSSAGEWITSRFPSPSPSNKEVPEFFVFFSMSGVFPTSSVTPLWSVHSTMGVFSRWWRRRSNYVITKYLNPPVQLVGQASSHQACLQHTHSLGALSGVSLNGKHEKLELDLAQVFDLVGFQLAWKSVRSDPP